MLALLLKKDRYTVLGDSVPDFHLKQQEDTQVEQGISMSAEDEDGDLYYFQESNLGIPQANEISAAFLAWEGLNQDLLQPFPTIKVIVSANEADITILNFLSARHGTTISILMGNDSDYHFFTEDDDLHHTSNQM